MNTNKTSKTNALNTVFGAQKNNNVQLAHPVDANSQAETMEAAGTIKAASDACDKDIRPASKTLLTVDIPLPAYRQMKLTAARERTHIRDIVVNKIETFCDDIEKMDDDQAKSLIESLRPLKEQTQRTTLMANDSLIADIREKAAYYLVPIKAFMQAAFVAKN